MKPSSLLNAVVVGVAASVAAGSAVSAQDVEMLGRHYGTPVPAAYYRTLAERADAFRFTRGRTARLRDRMELAAARGAPNRAGAPSGGPALAGAAPMTVLGPREGPVEGVFTIPVLLARFWDSPEAQPYEPAAVHDRLFGPAGRTARTYYEEVSRGMVSLRGDVLPWRRAVSPQYTSAWVTNGGSGLTPRTPTWIKALMDGAEDRDWGLYDNDGPDGVPNSGDDDGYVDALAVIHPTEGAECGSAGSDDRIWSHKWSLSGATGSAYTTASASANGGLIRIDDYFTVGLLSCSGGALNEIGVFTHETGHAFGLPDLYDTQGSNRHAGAGNWELMATGSWGCDNASPDTPCHMGAWSKAALGWLDVVDVPPGSGLTRLTIPPVARDGVVYRVPAGDGSGEYFLLENRQRDGFDRNLRAAGLLVWHVDPDWVQLRWATNSVNAGSHRGVWLREADGQDDLGRPDGGRGGAGDPFPYAGNDVFHASSTPASLSHAGTATGATLIDIVRVGSDIELAVANRFARVTLRSDRADQVGDLFTVDGQARAGNEVSFLSAPFQRHALHAAGGAPLTPGVRLGFQEWVGVESDGRRLDFTTPLDDTALVARYAGRQLQLAVDVLGSVPGVTPATFHAMPFSEDLWFAEGARVTVEVRPRTGFGFLEWTGALAGQPNPATVSMTEPVSAGATFEVTYRVPSVDFDIEAARRQSIGLHVENGNHPIRWLRVEGALPDGLLLSNDGTISGVPVRTGSFSVVLEARDAIGLSAQATVAFDVDEPTLAATSLAAPWLLTGTPPTEDQQVYLDQVGNRDGRYDLGDMRAWILAHPTLPTTTAVRALVGTPDLAGAPEEQGR